MKDLLAWGLVCSGACWALACAGRDNFRAGGSEAGATTADSNAGASSGGRKRNPAGNAWASSDGTSAGRSGGDGGTTGGRATTGAATGGVAAGGAATGGIVETGGVAAGGAATGGTVETGGVAASGAATGGTVETGGVAAGGAATGGRTMGGTATGGVAVGTGGHATGGGPGLSCDTLTPCGGQVVGTWTATSSCLDVTGELDLSLTGLGCDSAPVTGSLEVTGTWTAQADGTYVDDTSTSGQQHFTLAAECLAVSGTTTSCERVSPALYSLGYSWVDCADAASGGCDCTGSVEQTGGLGMVSWNVSPSGTYKASAKKMTTSDDTEYAYCVSGNTMTILPLGGSVGTVSGTVVLEAE